MEDRQHRLGTELQTNKTYDTAQPENLLLEAYIVRIKYLLDQNLAAEAKTLVELVEQRFPSAKVLLNDVGKMAAAKNGDLVASLQALNDAKLSAARRAKIQIRRPSRLSLETKTRAAPSFGKLGVHTNRAAEQRQLSKISELPLLCIIGGPVSEFESAQLNVKLNSPNSNSFPVPREQWCAFIHHQNCDSLTLCQAAL